MFLKKVEEGRQGLNAGLKSFLPKLLSVTNNIQDSEYHLFGAMTKFGKTSFIHQFYILGTFLFNPEKDIRYLFFSYEMPMYKMIGKAIAFLAYHLYSKTIPDDLIFSKGNKRLSNEDLEVVRQIYVDYIIPLYGEFNDEGRQIKEGKITFVEKRINPTGMRHVWLNHFGKFGKRVDKLVHYEQDGIIKTRYEKVGYVKNNPDFHNITLLDHFGLVPREKNYTKKETIDKVSEYILEDRNTVGGTWVAVSQFNRSMSSVDRLKFSADNLAPVESDYKNSNNPLQDCDLAIGGFNPCSFKHLTTHLDYDLTQLDHIYRSLHLMVNRNGTGFIDLACYFKPECGYFEELPSPENINYNNYANR